MFTFHIENHEPFEPLTKNCPTLDKNKSIVSSFLVFVVYKSAVSTVQKSNYVGCFNFVSECLYFLQNRLNCIFRAGKKISPTISLFFRKMTAEVSRNDGTVGFITICTSQSI